MNVSGPHHGFGAPKQYIRRYDDVEIPLVTTRVGELDGTSEIQRPTA